jgi:hypothetical protein
MNKTLQIPVRTYDVKTTDNPDFTVVKIMAIKEGLNLNNSIFTLEGMQQCKDSFLGKPLMCAFPKDYINNSYKMGDEHNDDGLKYDKDTDTYYYSYLDADSERCVGFINPNQQITIENINGENWIVLEGIIFKKYNYELIKDILNSDNKPDDIANNSKRVSVEVEVLNCNIENNIEILNLWTGDGVTILGNDVAEGIPGANLQLKTYSESPKFARFKQSLSFAYKSAEDKNKLNESNRNNQINNNKELGLNMDNLAKVESSNEEYTYLFSDNTEKEKEDIMAKKINKDENFESKDKEKDLKMTEDTKPEEKECNSKEDKEDVKTDCKDKETEARAEKEDIETPKNVLSADDEKECNSKKCEDGEEFTETGDVNEDYKAEDKSDVEKDKVKESKECNDADEDYKKKCEALEAKYSELKNKYDDLSKKCEAEVIEKESAITKCAEAEKKCTEMKHDKFTAEANVILNDNLGLDEKDMDEIATMVKEFKFEAIKDLKKEIGYRQFERKEKLKEESNSLSFGLNTNIKLNNKESKSNMIDTLDKIINEIK